MIEVQRVTIRREHGRTIPTHSLCWIPGDGRKAANGWELHHRVTVNMRFQLLPGGPAPTDSADRVTLNFGVRPMKKQQIGPARRWEWTSDGLFVRQGSTTVMAPEFVSFVERPLVMSDMMILDKMWPKFAELIETVSTEWYQVRTVPL